MPGTAGPAGPATVEAPGGGREVISVAVAGGRAETLVPLGGPLTETVPDSVPRRRVTALARVPAELADAVPPKAPTTPSAERGTVEPRTARLRRTEARSAGAVAAGPVNSGPEPTDSGPSAPRSAGARTLGPTPAGPQPART
ncbi:hypothetical protein I3F58_12840, partial [Streptomyces sp. MUM 203J]|nr:hypothetical protein [Streptomyces sp. MUM 203J]